MAFSPVLHDSLKASLLDDYELEGELGQGAFSIVYAGTDKVSADLAAIKKLTKYQEIGGVSWETQQKLILREVQALKAIKGGPTVIELLGSYEDENDIYLVFELLLGAELFDLICEEQFPEDRARQIISQILDAISWCHDRNVIHRDIKPENIMMVDDQSQSLKLIDFGLAYVIEDDTQCTEQAGSPGYLAPEILLNQPYGKPVDMWSLGVSAYFLLSGYLPWDENKDVSIEEQITKADYSFDLPEWQTISQHAKEFISACLSLDQTARISAKQAINHPFITQKEPVLPEETPQEAPLSAREGEGRLRRKTASAQRKPRRNHAEFLELIAGILAKAAAKKNTHYQIPEHTPKKSLTEFRAETRSRADDDEVPCQPKAPKEEPLKKHADLQDSPVEPSPQQPQSTIQIIPHATAPKIEPLIETTSTEALFTESTTQTLPQATVQTISEIEIPAPQERSKEPPEILAPQERSKEPPEILLQPEKETHEATVTNTKAPDALESNAKPLQVISEKQPRQFLTQVDGTKEWEFEDTDVKSKLIREEETHRGPCDGCTLF